MYSVCKGRVKLPQIFSVKYIFCYFFLFSFFLNSNSITDLFLHSLTYSNHRILGLSRHNCCASPRRHVLQTWFNTNACAAVDHQLSLLYALYVGLI